MDARRMDVFSFSFWRRQFLSASPLTKGEEKKSREERRSEGGAGTGKKKEEEVARRGESFIYTRDILFILADAVSPVSNDTHSVTCYASSTFHPFSGSLYTITSSLRTRQRRVLSTDVKFSTIIDASTMRRAINGIYSNQSFRCFPIGFILARDEENSSPRFLYIGSVYN